MKDQIGGYGKKADATFRKNLKTGFRDILAKLEEFYGDERLKKMGFDRPMGNEEEIASAQRFMGRHATVFRKAYWNAMRVTDPLFEVAIRSENALEYNQQAKRDLLAQSDEEIEEGREKLDSRNNLNNLNAEDFGAFQAKIEDLRRQVASEKAKGARVALERSLAPEEANQRRQVNAAHPCFEGRKDRAQEWP